MEITSVEVLLETLKRYVASIAWRQSSSNRLSVLLEPCDIISELNIELVVCWQYYSGKVDSDDLLKLAKVMLSHRMSELIHKFHGTHRNAESTNASTNDKEYMDANSINPAAYAEMVDNIQALIRVLTNDELDLLDALINEDDPRMLMWIKVYAMRRSVLYATPTVKITYGLLADALHMSKEQVAKLHTSIRDKWRVIRAR